MDKPKSKADLLNQIRTARAELETVLARIGEAKMLESGIMDGWTVKDVVAHIVAWERRLDSWLQAAATGETPVEPVPQDDEEVDRMNAASFAADQERPLPDVLADFHRSYREVLERVERFVSDENLEMPLPAAWSRGSPVWITIAANTYWHYDEHTAALAAWLDA